MESAATRRLIACALFAWATIVASLSGAFVASGDAKVPAAPLAVHVIYATPTDKPVRPAYEQAIKNAIVLLQAWYLGQVGKTFAIASPTPKICHLPHRADYYLVNTWDKISQDLQPCAPVTYAPQSTAEAVWIVYADVDHTCNTPGPIGEGGPGLTILGVQDLDGLTGAHVRECGQSFVYPVGRYIGGLGHELAHGFGLPHPPGCDKGLPTCAKNQYVVLWLGYVTWPDTYLNEAERGSLRKDRFFRLTKSILPVVHGGNGLPTTPTGGGGSPASCTSGAYKGTSSQGRPVSFTVSCSTSGGIVTNLSFGHIDETCTPSGSQSTSISLPMLQFGSDGSLHVAASGPTSFKVEATIASGKAIGTLHVDGPNRSGQDCSADLTWNAAP